MIDRVVVARVALREATLLVLCVLGAILFLNHQVLYFDGSPPSSVGWPSYVASTLVIYGFVQGVSLVATRRSVRIPSGPARCPECGQPLEGDSPSRALRVPDHPHRTTPNSQPATEARAVPPALASSLVNPPAPLADEVVDALLLRVVMGTPYEAKSVRSQPSKDPPPSDRLG